MVTFNNRMEHKLHLLLGSTRNTNTNLLLNLLLLMTTILTGVRETLNVDSVYIFPVARDVDLLLSWQLAV